MESTQKGKLMINDFKFYDTYKENNIQRDLNESITLTEIKAELRLLTAEVKMRTRRIDDLIDQWETLLIEGEI